MTDFSWIGNVFSMNPRAPRNENFQVFATLEFLEHYPEIEQILLLIFEQKRKGKKHTLYNFILDTKLKILKVHVFWYVL